MRNHIYLLLYILGLSESLDINSYNDARWTLLNKEYLMGASANVTLNEKELEVNRCLMHFKLQQLNYSFIHPQNYSLSEHYFIFKDEIKNSKVYQILKAMPKGAVLHVHDKAMLDADYYLKLTYIPDLYVCFGSDRLHLRFSDGIPKMRCDAKWHLIADLRKSSDNITEFDQGIRKHFSIISDNFLKNENNITYKWLTLGKFFAVVTDLITFRPIWEKQFYDSLLKFRNDNIMYVELRSALSGLYEANGTYHDTLTTARAFDRVVKKFKNDYPDFIGAKLIYSLSRRMNTFQLKYSLDMAREIKKAIPYTFVGFDLVGQEETGYPFTEYIPLLLEARKEMLYFFHAGETLWYGTSADENLVDAILLNSTRIGHAYALPKHPVLMQEVAKRNICIEVNLISNKVLSFVKDPRNHPLSIFLANNLLVTISSDDPGAWEGQPATEDYYVTFLSSASKFSDLRLLKQLAINSFICSALDENKKAEALARFNERWDHFINDFDCSNYKI